MARGARRHDSQGGRCCRLRELQACFTSAAGADERIWDTLCGFRPGRGILDAVFLIRRIVEEASAMQDKRLVLLALDWATAFDSIAPEALCQSLGGFGLPAKFLRCIEAIYANRCLSASDAGKQSGQQQLP
eukprot:6283930-Pyramimonas_sp.AAC.1